MEKATNQVVFLQIYIDYQWGPFCLLHLLISLVEGSLIAVDSVCQGMLTVMCIFNNDYNNEYLIYIVHIC